MQATTDPGVTGSESLATVIADELQRVRYVLTLLGGGTQWYAPMQLKNNTGVTLAVGDVVAIDSAAASQVKLDDTASSTSQFVVALDTPANTVQGRFKSTGQVQTVNVSNATTIGNYLVKSATTRQAKDSAVSSGSATALPVGAFAIALTSTAGAGNVKAMLLGQTIGSVGIAAGTLNGVAYFSAATTLASTAQGATGTVLHGNAGVPTFSSVSLTADVTGILPGANGGTGNGFFAVAGPATALKTFTFPNASANVLTDNALVTVAQGGTGAGTLTLNGVLFGNGTGTVQVTAQGAAGTVLHGNAGVPTFSLVSLTADVTGTLSGANGGTGVTGPYTTGGVPFGQGTNVLLFTASGAGTAVLHGGGGTPSFSSVVNGDIAANTIVLPDKAAGGAANTVLATVAGVPAWTATPTVTGITPTGGTVTVSTPVFNATQTWNNAATAFTFLQGNVTNTASAAGSLLLDLQVGGISQFNITKAGVPNVGAGGSTVISTGVGSVKMSNANAATNASWIPFSYAGTVYFVPGWTTNSP